MADKRQLFIDTSALVKYFHEEPGSERVSALIDDEGSLVWIAALARAEFASAMHRKFREHVLTKDQLKHVLTGFNDVIQAFRTEPLGPDVVDTAEQLIRTHGRGTALRTLDALHLATFLLVQTPGGRFVVADDRLYAIAREEECALIHPVRDM